MIEIISYILFFIVLIILIFYIYIKLKFGFWVIQPVFHVYDIFYMIWPPGIINHTLPTKNKYTNFKNIETITYDKATDLQLNKLVNFIKLNYLQNKDNIFNPKLENITPYFQCHNTTSFLSLYNEENSLLDLKKSTIVKDNKIIGIMTSRPIHIIINNGDFGSNFHAYYVDYLCVDKSYRKKGIAPQIIQTHHYNQSHLNEKIRVSLFKREDELTGIVPLCVYSTYGFSINKWNKPQDLHTMYKVIEINSQNFYLLFDFIMNNQTYFDIFIYTEITNITNIIRTNNIYVYAILYDNKIICAYFFRKTCVFIKKNMEVLSCFASINNCSEVSVFIQGFKISFWKISHENKFGFSAIENISHNNIIIDNIKLKTKPLIISPTAYFFYNFAYNTFNSDRVLIIN